MTSDAPPKCRKERYNKHCIMHEDRNTKTFLVFLLPQNDVMHSDITQIPAFC